MLNFAILFVLLSCVATVRCWQHETGSNLDTIISENDAVLVAFVVPETQASKALEPEWRTATKSITPVPLISIDCTLSPEICSSHDVVSFPAIRLYQGSKSKFVRYRNSRTSSAILAFLPRALRPLLTPLTSSNHTQFQNVDPAGVFIAYLPSSNIELLEQYTAVAEKYGSVYTFGKMVPKGNIRRIEFHKHGEIATWNGAGDEDQAGSLEKWVKAVGKDVVGRLSRRNEGSYLNSGKSLVYLFADTKKELDTLQILFLQLGKKYIDYLVFVTVDTTEYGHMLGQVGLVQPVKLPAVALYNPKMGQVFPYDQTKEVEPNTIDGFVMDIVTGKIAPLGSEPVSDGRESAKPSSEGQPQEVLDEEGGTGSNDHVENESGHHHSHGHGHGHSEDNHHAHDHSDHDEL